MPTDPDPAAAPDSSSEHELSAVSEPESFTFLQPPMSPDSLGRLGHYEVLNVLGRGGFGIVFRAFDDVLQRVVAIKVMAPEMAATSPARKRFLREARGYAGIRHENVVQVHAIESDPIPYIVMEFIPGESLETLLNRTGPLNVEDTIRISLQVARGLAAAHAIGLVHRDIKPGNVLIENGPERRVKLTDFGLALAADDANLTRSGMVAGTPMYMAPEQARGETVDHRADLFSLGSVMYTMITGRPPFRSSGGMAVMRRVIDDQARPIREVIPETPPRLCSIIEKLHEKEPVDRHQSAAELADDLAACLADPNAPLPAPAKSRWIWIAAGVGLVAAIVAAILIAMNSKPPSGDPPPQPPPSSLPSPTAWVTDEGEWGPPENLGPGVNSTRRELSPAFTSDELEIVFNRDEQLWMSRRTSITDPFGPAERLPDSFRHGRLDTPTLTGDGLQLVFKVVGQGEEPINSVWMSKRRSRSDSFGEPVLMPEPVNRSGKNAWSVAPAISSDGLTLIVTQSPGDLVQFTRASRDKPFTNEVVLPEPVKSSSFEIATWASDDRRVLLSTREREKTFTTYLFHRTDPAAPFTMRQFSPPGSETGRAWVSPDGQRMYFHRQHSTKGRTDLDIWVSRWKPKQ